MTNPKNILITGASSGIGAALAENYAGSGVTLFLMGRDAVRLNAVADSARAKGATVQVSTVAVTDRDAMARQIAAWDDASPVDLVIANAGISGGSSGGAGFHDILAVNLHGAVNTVDPLIARMQKRGAGQIALVSSMAGWRGMPNAVAYSTSKVALRAYGDALRPILKQSGVHLSVIFPGFIKTPLTDVNNFPMPFLMTAEKAAGYIVRGLAARKNYVAFPWPMYLLTRIIAALPNCIADVILMKAPKK